MLCEGKWLYPDDSALQGFLRKECWDGSCILETSLSSVAKRMGWQGQGWWQDHSWRVTIVIRREMMRPTQTLTWEGDRLEKYRGW